MKITKIHRFLQRTQFLLSIIPKQFLILNETKHWIILKQKTFFLTHCRYLTLKKIKDKNTHLNIGVILCPCILWRLHLYYTYFTCIAFFIVFFFAMKNDRHNEKSDFFSVWNRNKTFLICWTSFIPFGLLLRSKRNYVSVFFLWCHFIVYK